MSHTVPPDAAASVDATASAGRTGLFARLITMMVLEFVVFGSWFATIGLVLATNGLATSIAAVYSLAALAALISPMFLGALGDRYLPSQKVLGIAHLAGGVVMAIMPSMVTAANGTVVIALAFVYMIFFQPTLSLTNFIAFHHLGDDTRKFPYIRVFGTLGWVIAGLLVGAMGLSASANIFLVTAVFSVVLGIYSFTLPNTPPPAKGSKFSFKDVIGARAFVLLRHRNTLIFFICAILTGISLGVYNTWASPFLGVLGISNVAGVLAIGQASEVAFILTIPWALKRFGMKWSLLAGMFMWGVRFFLFAAAAHSAPMWAIVAVALHGICNDFFLVLGAMYLDKVAPLTMRAQAQGLLILVINGIGQLAGSAISGAIYNNIVVNGDGATAWTPLWVVPIASALLTAVLWIVGFRQRRDAEVVRIEVATPVSAATSVTA